MIKSDLRQQRPKTLKIYDYAMAVLSVAVAIVLTEIAARLLQTEPVASLMLCAVISAAWLGGFGPALLAIVLALFAFHYDMLPPVNSFAWKHDVLAVDVEQLSRLTLFAITSLFVSFVVTAQRKATEDLRRSRDDLRAAIEDQKRVEAALLHSEMHLTEAQRLSRTGSFGWNASTGEIFWTDETFRIFQFDRTTRPSVKCIIERTHPEDRAAVQEAIDRASREARDFNHEYRLLMPDGSVKYVHAVARSTKNESGGIEFIGAISDVTAAREAERKLRRSEAYLAETQHLSHTSSWAWDVRHQRVRVSVGRSLSPVWFDPERDAGRQRPFRDRIAPEDRRAGHRGSATGNPGEIGFRSRFSDRSSGRIGKARAFRGTSRRQ